MVRLRVGVVGCGVIAQVMHLPHLQRLSDRFEVVALCDLSPSLLRQVGEAFGVERRFTRWEDLLEVPLDAVLVLTSADHGPVAAAAAETGRHVFVEKPMCLLVEDGRRVLDVAAATGVRLMVGYMKRYDPAYERLTDEFARTDGLRHVTVTTMESPWQPYVAHHRIARRRSPEPAVDAELTRLRQEEDLRLEEAIGTDDPLVLRTFREILVDSMIHELNLVRGVLGEPTALEFASIREHGVTAVLSFGGTQGVFSWVDLPGIARYRQELVFLAPERRVRLTFPSPYLRNMPTGIAIEEGELEGARSWERVEVASYEEAFERELLEFHAAVVEEREPRTPGTDGLRDVALCEAIVRCHLEGRPVGRPTDVPGDP